MMTNGKPIALREWAVAIRALEEGEQIVILRKGGIAEETGTFELESRFFYFFPGYEHQKHALVKEEYRHWLDESLRNWTPEGKSVTIRCYAEAVEDLLVHDEAELEKIRDFHIWTDTFAEDRLHWKRKQPLHLIILRVYRLEPPFEAEVLAEYAGCKSWIELQTTIPDTAHRPVLSEEAFKERVEQIKRALNR